MRLLIDMNLTRRWIGALTALGHQAEHWSDVGSASASDAQISEYARLKGFAILTNDLDFPRILAFTKQGKPSIILLRGQPLTPELRIASLAQALTECAVEIEAGAILTIDWDGRPRARLLPLP